jgi:regulator of protease activity HflC (stomatin/prohibitin superfamily)
LVTIWGQRKDAVIKEGWHLFAPFWPFLYSVITVDVKKKDKDFAPRDVKTKDMAGLSVNISMTYAPDKDDPNCLAEYMNSGGQKGVEDILDDVVGEAIRELMLTMDTWEEGVKAHTTAADVLIERIFGVDKTSAVEISKKLRAANGSRDISRIPSLGVVIHRLNVPTIKVLGKLAEDSELSAREKRQREADKIEIDNISDRTKTMMGVGLTAKDAVEVVQTERGKVKKEIKEYKGLDGLGKGIGKGIGLVFKGK